MPTFKNSEIGKIFYCDGSGNARQIQKAYYVNGNTKWLVFSAAEPTHEYVHEVFAKKRLRTNFFGDLTPQKYDAFYQQYISVTAGKHIYLRAVMGMWAQSVHDVRGHVLIEWYTSSKTPISQERGRVTGPTSPMPHIEEHWTTEQKYDAIENGMAEKGATSILDTIYRVPANAAYVRIGQHLDRGSGDYGAGQGIEYLIEGVVADVEEPYSCGYTNKDAYAALFPKKNLEDLMYPPDRSLENLTDTAQDTTLENPTDTPHE